MILHVTPKAPRASLDINTFLLRSSYVNEAFVICSNECGGVECSLNILMTDGLLHTIPVKNGRQAEEALDDLYNALDEGLEWISIIWSGDGLIQVKKI